jgi:uncharacterized protein
LKLCYCTCLQNTLCDFHMDEKPFSQYVALLSRIEDYCSRLRHMHGWHISCGPGCSACCGQVLELLPVEFYYLQAEARAAALPGSVKTAGACPLLHEGHCLLYGHRPVICRTHGMPLLVEENGLQRVDCCPENFRQGALNTLSGGSLLHLERINLLLVSVNHLFAAARGIDAGQRISIERIFSPSKTRP